LQAWLRVESSRVVGEGRNEVTAGAMVKEE
jgi:hypothetical protein